MTWFTNLKIRTQVLLCVGIVSLVTVAVIFAVSVGMFASIGSQSKAIVESTLEEQALDYLLTASEGSADEISKRFITIEGLVTMVSLYANMSTAQ
jgi:predicted anti-sigma-YlaC factor YlaD